MIDKTPIVLLNGWASDPGVWNYQERYFSSQQLIKIKFHKGVEAAPVGQQPSLYSVAALAGINKATDQQVILLGWSLGALVALELAHLSPQRILGMILVGGTSRFTQDEGYHGGLAKVLVERLKKRLVSNPAQALKEFKALMFCPEEREAGIEEGFRQSALAQELDWSKEELLAGLDFLLNRDLRGLLKDIEVPALVIHGEKDEICPVAAGRYLKDNLRSSQFELLPHCGHVPFFSKVEDFNKRVRGWLNDLH